MFPPVLRHLLPGLRAGAVPLWLALAFTLACGSGGDAKEGESPGDIVVTFPSPTGSATARARLTPTPTVGPTPTPLKVCAPNPDPARPSLLQIEQPTPGQQVKVPFHVIGWGSNIGFQDRGVALAIVNAKQEVTQVLDLPPQPRTYRIAPPGLEITEFTKPFGADIVIDKIKEPTPFCIWVYQETTDNGTPKGVVQVPIIVVP